MSAPHERPPLRLVNGRSLIERAGAASSGDEGDRRLAELLARGTGQSPAAILDEMARARGEQASDARAAEVEVLQEASAHQTPGVARSGASGKALNRQLRRAQRRKRRVAKVVADMIQRARDAGDPSWEPQAFPGLDWKIGSEAWGALRDVSGRQARILAAGLPPAQGELLVADAKALALELGLEEDEGYATMRWRERVAAAWVSRRLSRPVRAREKEKGKSPDRARLGALLAKLEMAPDDRLKPPPKRENPWSGGRVVDGYARGAFALLMRDITTGKPLSASKLFYRNGSGDQGPFAYLATPASEHGERSRAIDGTLGLYTRWQPSASVSKYVGPVKRNAEGEILLDKDGNPMRFALSEHWYHRRMCGRRAATAADRGNAAAGSLLRELCPWLFEDDASPSELLGGLEALAASTEAAEDAEGDFEDAPSPAAEGGISRGPPAEP